MGDRGNIVLDYGNKRRIFLYTHWSGSELKTTLKKALIRGKSRWEDESYLARIIFCEMIKDDITELTGYGISPTITDNEHPLLIVDLINHKIWFETEEGNKIKSSYSYEEFVKTKFNEGDDEQ